MGWNAQWIDMQVVMHEFDLQLWQVVFVMIAKILQFDMVVQIWSDVIAQKWTMWLFYHTQNKHLIVNHVLDHPHKLSPNSHTIDPCHILHSNKK
jgi:hypothetical protein